VRERPGAPGTGAAYRLDRPVFPLYARPGL